MAQKDIKTIKAIEAENSRLDKMRDRLFEAYEKHYELMKRTISNMASFGDTELMESYADSMVYAVTYLARGISSITNTISSNIERLGEIGEQDER